MGQGQAISWRVRPSWVCIMIQASPAARVIWLGVVGSKPQGELPLLEMTGVPCSPTTEAPDAPPNPEGIPNRTFSLTSQSMLFRVPVGVVKGPPNRLHSPFVPLPLNDLAVEKSIPASLLHGPVWDYLGCMCPRLGGGARTGSWICGLTGSAAVQTSCLSGPLLDLHSICPQVSLPRLILLSRSFLPQCTNYLPAVTAKAGDGPKPSRVEPASFTALASHPASPSSQLPLPPHTLLG